MRIISYAPQYPDRISDPLSLRTEYLDSQQTEHETDNQPLSNAPK